MTGTEGTGQAPVPTTQPKKPMVGFHDGVVYRGGKPQSMKTYYRRESQARVVSKLRGERDFYDHNIKRTMSEVNMDGSLPSFMDGKAMVQRRMDRNPIIRRVRERVAARRSKS